MPGFVPPPFAAARPEPPPRAVDRDVPCRRCRYNLRGLSTDRRCPECGTPVGFSVRGDLLRYSDPAWVDRLARGAAFIQWYVALAITLTVADILIDRRWTPAGGDADVAVRLAAVAAYAVYAVGVWLLTAPDPSGLGEERYGTSRKLIRTTLWFGVGREAAKAAAVLAAPSPAVRLVLSLAAGVGGVASVVGLFATFVYLGRLAARVPDAEAMARCRQLMWGVSLPFAGLVVGTLLTGLAAAVGGGALAVVVLVSVVTLCGVTLVVFGLIYVRLLTTLGKRFTDQAAAARRAWAATAAGTDGLPPIGPVPPSPTAARPGTTGR